MYYWIYGIVFFLITLLIQYLLRNYRKNGGKLNIWIGTDCIIVICMFGIFQKDPLYFAAAIGFLLANRIGEKYGYH